MTTTADTMMAEYTIMWGHSGTRGKQWTTAREASRYAATPWGTVDAASPEAAVEAACSEGLDVGDWYEIGGMIHVIPSD